jgi:hypothetical protein
MAQSQFGMVLDIARKQRALFELGIVNNTYIVIYNILTTELNLSEQETSG